MIAFDARDGHMVWVNQRTAEDDWHPRFEPAEPDFDFGDSPHLYRLADGREVVSAGQKSGFYHVFDAATGAAINQFQVSPGSTLGGLFATAALDPETGVAFANDRFPHPGQPATGEVAAIAPDASHTLWELPTPSPDQSGVALANGVVYFQDLGGTFYALDEKTGKVLAQLFTGGANSSPAISNGRIFLGQGNALGHGFNSPGGIVALGLSKAEQAPFLQTNLVSDVSGMAEITDTNLKNPWGVSESSTSPFWVSDQGTSVSTLYAVTATGVNKLGLTVAIPKTAAGPQGPTGQVNNNTTAFVLNGRPAAFIFANLNGTISAWNGGTMATIEATVSGAIYTGLAIATDASGSSFLYAANGAQNRIDVFNGSFVRQTLAAGAFQDPLLPTDLSLVPFNVQNIGGSIYVTYAPGARAAQTGAMEGQGAVAVFDTSGHFIRQLIVGSKLASPWGITMAPTGFGPFGGDLLVGNFAYNFSEVNAFDASTGKFLGTLTDASGNPIRNQALWYIGFGNGGNGGDPNTLYFAAGINQEKDGLFGSLTPITSLKRHAPLVTNLPEGAKQTISTVPTTNGDLNPYGVAFVPNDVRGGGLLQPGDLLVSNFNNSANVQGRGSTIVRITPEGGRTVFFNGIPGQTLGLTTALGVLKSGFVLVGNVPTDAKGVAQQGSLIILDSNGKVVTQLTDPVLLDGPWDLALNDMGSTAQVFVANVLSGTVTRIDLTIPVGGTPQVESETQIASGYAHRLDPDVVALGPTGLAFDPKRDVLYVASTLDNKIFAIRDAATTRADHGTGRVVFDDPKRLHGPLGLVLLPNGDLVAANGDAVNPDPNHPNELVEFTPGGHFVDQFRLDRGASGAAFGVAVTVVNGELRFAAVDDNTNTVAVWTFVTRAAHHGHHGDGSDQDGGDRDGDHY
jgi:uncharacterized protein (TIGR03118 family)